MILLPAIASLLTDLAGRWQLATRSDPEFGSPGLVRLVVLIALVSSAVSAGIAVYASRVAGVTTGRALQAAVEAAIATALPLAGYYALAACVRSPVVVFGCWALKRPTIFRAVAERKVKILRAELIQLATLSPRVAGVGPSTTHRECWISMTGVVWRGCRLLSRLSRSSDPTVGHQPRPGGNIRWNQRRSCPTPSRVVERNDEKAVSRRALRARTGSRRGRRGHPVLQAPFLGAADSKRRNSPGIRGSLFEVPEASMGAAAARSGHQTEVTGPGA